MIKQLMNSVIAEHRDLSVGVFRLQKILDNSYWEFPFGKSAFHLSRVPFEGAAGGLAAKRPRKVWNW